MVYFFFTGVKDVNAINQDQTLGDLGLDSLMSVEVKQTLERDYDLALPIKEIRLLTFTVLDKLADQVSLNEIYVCYFLMKKIFHLSLYLSI